MRKASPFEKSALSGRLRGACDDSPKPPKFTVSYRESKLDQKYSFRHQTAKSDIKKRAAQTVQVYRVQPTGYTFDTPALDEKVSVKKLFYFKNIVRLYYKY